MYIILYLAQISLYKCKRNIGIVMKMKNNQYNNNNNNI